MKNQDIIDNMKENIEDKWYNQIFSHLQNAENATKIVTGTDIETITNTLKTSALNFMNEIQRLIAIGKEIHQKYDEMMKHMDEVTSYLLFANDIYVACGPDDNDLLDGIFDEKEEEEGMLIESLLENGENNATAATDTSATSTTTTTTTATTIMKNKTPNTRSDMID